MTSAMWNPRAIDDVLKLIELRRLFDDCQQQLLQLQLENTLLKNINAELARKLCLQHAGE